MRVYVVVASAPARSGSVATDVVFYQRVDALTSATSAAAASWQPSNTAAVYCRASLGSAGQREKITIIFIHRQLVRVILLKPRLHAATGCIVYANIQPVVKPVWQPVWQPVGCLFTRYSRLSNRLYNRSDNRLYRVNGVLEACRPGAHLPLVSHWARRRINHWRLWRMVSETRDLRLPSQP